MRKYLLKYEMIYYVCNCPENIIIPTNDFLAYEYYENKKNKNFMKLFDKQIIAETQLLENGDKNKMPSKFPVIIRPKINLYGMGKDAYYGYKMEDIRNINQENFWCEVLEGKFYGVDIFLNKNGIQGIIAFEGIRGKLFTFDYWEYMPNYKLSKNIVNWINKYMTGLNGVFNLEILDGKIIECNMRLGDSNFFQSKEITYCIIDCYLNKDLILPKFIPKIYLIPVFVKKGDYKELSENNLYQIVRKFDKKNKYVLNFLIDPINDIGNPEGGDRVCNFTVIDLDIGKKIRKYILENIFFY